MQRDTSGPGPDLKDLQFRPRDRIAADLGVGAGPDEARAIARLRKRWRWLAGVQVLVIATITGWVLFTQYGPDVTLAVPVYVMCLLMMAGGGISIAVSAFVDFDAERHPRGSPLPMAENLLFAPLAGLVGWGTTMVMFWRFLHGWDPGSAAFFITNPFGAYLASLGISMLAMPVVASPLAAIMASLRQRREDAS